MKQTYLDIFRQLNKVPRPSHHEERVADFLCAFAEQHGLEFPLIADTDTTLLQALGCWGEKVACGRRTIGTLRTTYLVN